MSVAVLLLSKGRRQSKVNGEIGMDQEARLCSEGSLRTYLGSNRSLGKRNNTCHHLDRVRGREDRTDSSILLAIMQVNIYLGKDRLHSSQHNNSSSNSNKRNSLQSLKIHRIIQDGTNKSSLEITTRLI